MDFSVEFYVGPQGQVPVRDFLDALAASDPEAHAKVLRGLVRLRDRSQHREPLCKALGDGLFELRCVGVLNTRVLWFFMVGRRIVAVHGIRHKAQQIPPQELRTARERQADWLRRKS